MAEINSKIEQQNKALQTPLENKGKKINKISARHARRKLNDFKTSAGKALWFAKSFGLEPDFIQTHTSSGKKFKISLFESMQPQQSNEPECSHESDDMKIKQILFLLDKFSVGDAFYHELTQINHSLPRSYKVKQTRQQLNNSVEINRIPGYEDVYRPFEKTLAEELSRLVSNTTNTCIVVCVCGGFHAPSPCPATWLSNNVSNKSSKW